MVLNLERCIEKKMQNNFIKTKKYKTISLYLYFTSNYDLKKYLALNLLSFFIGDYSLKYPTKEKMTFAKDNLYGANVYTGSKAKAGLTYFSVKYTFLNPSFVDTKEEEFVDFFKELIYHPYFSKELLDEFKMIYKDNIRRSLDKPDRYANNRVNQIIALEDSTFKTYTIEDIDMVDKISLDDVIKTYKELLNDFGVDVFLYGDYSDDLLSIAKSLERKHDFHFLNKELNLDEMNDVIENKNVSQSSLQIVYKTPINRTSKQFYAYMMGNAVFGILPTSLLFDEVREKLSLCYYISILDYKNEGLVKVFTAIDGKNKDEVVKQVNIQFERMINKDYDPIKLDYAYALLSDSLNALQDNIDAYTEYFYMNALNGIECSRQEYIENLKKVSVDDISDVFKKYKHVLTYMLNGVKNEKDS